MIQNLTLIRRIVWGISAVQAGLFVASAAAGQISSTTSPVASGPGLGFTNILGIETTNSNNDDAPGLLSDNNRMFPLKRFDFPNYIDIVFTVTPTGGVTEYQVNESVDNNTGFNWNAYILLLGFGTGAEFTQAGGIGDGLDFDTGPPGGNSTPPTSTAMPIVTRPNDDSLVFSGGTQGSSAQQYLLRVDVPDLLSRNGAFTLRQQPIAVLGDYNGNGTVDAADYVVWRKTDGAPAGYTTWRTNFGEPGGSGATAGANATVPEPTMLVLLILAAAAVAAPRRWCPW